MDSGGVRTPDSAVRDVPAAGTRYSLPEPFGNDVGEQDLYGYESASFGGGEAGQLTVELPGA